MGDLRVEDFESRGFEEQTLGVIRQKLERTVHLHDDDRYHSDLLIIADVAITPFQLQRYNTPSSAQSRAASRES